ncbi:hypothetical protein LEN26_016282 [Aphanomyces euteiches]|uniref:Uncharacterized protein n=1 Tax=Aphanomyces euteiches TaxID=100861 RepID=A0A6G0WLG9_9STRA|nr:hypothetical protein Ae201684_013955 [Aphanomyces euteiches]KAH9083179.1 hypothetical protein Ae201684P_014076 [Aphanomyces euteiches]KAH9099138.1 hypothetical protein LEN26_016282 [Aphanomyces euteiches]KAH9105341.1 hypothetical protein AeMF1_018792 [Aphanomyces euteiches]KAH9145974.1 hypothetical protein AeRB84_010145 [Aphanomyces euteiches]
MMRGCTSRGVLTIPEMDFVKPSLMTAPTFVFPAPFLPGTYGEDVVRDVAEFTAAFAAQSATLKDFVMMNESSVCGNTRTDRKKIALPKDQALLWQNPPTNFLSPWGVGPCEVWLDDTRVLYLPNCKGNNSKAGGWYIQVDWTSCVDECTMAFYFVEIHWPQWRAYKNCARLFRPA